MKNLLLITVFFLVFATRLSAQDNDQIKIIDLNNGIITNNENKFKIVTNEELDIDLKIYLNKFDSYKVLVLNKKGELVYSKRINKEGKNQVSFTSNQNEQYTVQLINEQNDVQIANIAKD
ncbi:MAG TPA: hypothetical protein VN192_03470 [Flavobacterium sp.]|jgi:sensor domain CHASE-containing protein|nr:hypothetical protein [Flavobacterium sp.]